MASPSLKAETERGNDMPADQRPLLLISSDFPPVSGGQSRYLFDLWSQLPPADVVVLAPRLEGDAEVDRGLGCRVERLDLPLGNSRLAKISKALLLSWAAWRLCRRHRVRAVHCGQVLSAGIAGLACRFFGGVPYSVYVYGADMLEFYRRPLWGSVLRRVLRRADAVFAISRYTAEIAGRCGVAQDRLELVPPALDLRRFDAETRGAAWRRRHGLGEGPVLFSLSRLVERKGQDTVIRALASLRRRWPDLRYVIGGAGPYRGALEDLARSCGVEEAVDFVGFVPEEELPSAMAAADVFVMVSRQLDAVGEVEGFGIVYLEANAAGVPVLAGRSGGAGDAVEDGVNGVLVDPDSVGDVGDGLARLLSDEGLRQRLGRTGKERVERDFDRRRRAARLWDLCR